MPLTWRGCSPEALRPRHSGAWPHVRQSSAFAAYNTGRSPVSSFRQDLLEGAAMLVELKNGRRRQRGGWMRGQKEFIDMLATELAHRDLPMVRRRQAAREDHTVGDDDIRPL